MKLKKIICVFLACVAVLGSLAACRADDATEKPIVQEQIEESNVLFVENGTSDYQIVLSQNATETEKYAAEELNYFLSLSIGQSLPIVTDENISYDTNRKLVSIGATKLLSESGVALKKDELGTDGYKIVRKGSLLFLSGYGERGKLYSVYEFLERNFGLEIYAADEIFIEQKSDVKLLDFNLTDVPDFEGRDMHGYDVIIDPTFAGRIRNNGFDIPFPEKIGGGSAWPSSSIRMHTCFTLLPPQTYYEEHPNWYASEKNASYPYGVQLCWSRHTGLYPESADDSMLVEMVERLKEVIVAEPNAKFFSVTESDYDAYCKCDVCQLYVDELKYSGLQLNFVNEIARRIAAWAEENCPQREIYIVTFAYHGTLQPPLDENGNALIQAEENVAIRFAPISAAYDSPLKKEYSANYTVAKAIDDWQKVADNLIMYIYQLNYMDYLVPFGDFSSLKENLLLFKEKNVIDVMNQGYGDSGGTAFYAFRTYVGSKLMWDTSLDYQTLTDNFFKAYYKDAAGKVREYFELLRTHYAYLQATNNDFNVYTSNNKYTLLDAKYWSKAFLENCENLLKDAEEIARNSQTDAEKLSARIRTESLSIKYMLIELYGSTYSREELKNRIDTFEVLAQEGNLTHYRENFANPEQYTIKVKINEWRKQL